MNEHWPEISLSQLATITMGQSPEAACVSTDERGLAFLQGCAEFGARVPSPKLHCSPPLRVAKSGSVLISVRAPVGTTNFADQEYCIGRGLGAVTAKPEAADNIFLLHAIEQNVGFLHRRSQGSTFLAIGSKELSALPVPALPLATQRRTAEILSTVDESIEQTEALIAKYQQIKAGLMHDLFTRGVTPNGHLRPTRAQAPHLYRESPLGWIPKAWEVKPLSAFTQYDITYGIVQAGPHIENGVPYIRTGDMAGDRLVRAELLCTSRIIADSYKRSEVRSGEIVCAIRATVGKVLRVPSDLDGANLTQGTARIAPNSKTDPTFLLWAIRSERTQRAISLSIKGTTFNEITLGELRRLPVAVPVEVLEQQLIGNRMDECDKFLEAESMRHAKLRQQKYGLMHDLLTGRVRVKVGEPAST